MGNRGPDERAVSPVVGVALLLAIVVALSAMSTGMFLGLSEQPQPSPDVTLSIEAADPPGKYAVVHDAGDDLDGDRIELQGAADPDTLDGSELSAGERGPLYAVDETIDVVWVGDDGTSYVIREFDLESDTEPAGSSVPGVDSTRTVPEPDEGCEWVEAESDGGTEDVKADGVTVACDVETDKVIEVQNGGAVLGETASGAKEVDADDATFYGDVAVETNLNLQDGTIFGGVTSNDLVKIDGGNVDGGIEANDTVEVLDGSAVADDVVSDGSLVKVDESDVLGSIATDGDVKLQNATVEGDVYVAPAEFDCTDSTVNGRSCAAYEPKDPEDY